MTAELVRDKEGVTVTEPIHFGGYSDWRKQGEVSGNSLEHLHIWVPRMIAELLRDKEGMTVTDSIHFGGVVIGENRALKNSPFNIYG